MCGIIGYSDYRPAVPLLIEGLRRLEYRGYDSSGVTFVKGSGVEVRKAAGKLSNLETKLDDSACMLATAGIGHTRWATHGLPVERNAHPHLSQDGKIAIIHNGIIENFQELQDELISRGHTCGSDFWPYRRRSAGHSEQSCSLYQESGPWQFGLCFRVWKRLSYTGWNWSP